MGFQAGLSGLNASAKALDVVGNNIANSGTVGFKSARGEFGDVFAASLAGAGGAQVGVGTTISGVAQQFTQGNVTTTSNSMDVAINGGGFFRMSNNGAISFTRNGQFQLDKNGFIVNASGYRLTGYPADYSVDPAGIIVPSTPQDLFIDPSDLQPKATDVVSLGLNLDSRSTIANVGHRTFNPSDPLSYTSSTSATVYDSLGNQHVLTMFFVKTPNPGEWKVRYAVDTQADTTVDDGDSSTVDTIPGASNFVTVGDDQTLQFDSSGKLTSPSSAVTLTLDMTAVMTANNKTNSANQLLTFTLDYGNCTQFGSPFGVNKLTQSGFSSGRMAGLSISADGVIQGRYSNGQTRNMGQIVLAKFNNPNGLQNLGGNQWQETSASGQPLVGAPGAGSNGVVQSGSVEESNVDLTAELVNMITQQRAYQASAQTIKTMDQVLQTMVNLR